MLDLSNLHLIGGAVVVGIALATWRLITVRRFYKDLPKPPHSFLWGHLKLVKDMSALFPHETYPQAFYTEIAYRYNMPDVWYLDLWPLYPPIVMLNSPEAAQEALVVKVFPSHPWNEYLFNIFLGPNIIAASKGAKWRELHHLIAPSFTPMAVKGQTDTIVEHVSILHDRLSRLAITGEQFPIRDLLCAATFDIISSAVFGFSMSAQQHGSEFLDDFKVVFTLGYPFVQTLNPFKKFLMGRKIRAAKKRSDTLLHARIKERHAAIFGNEKFLQEEKRTKLCVMDRMVVQRIEEMGDKVRGGLDAEFIKVMTSNLKGLLAGGEGTTADTLSFVYLFLGLYPDVMQRLRDEHDQVFSPSFDETVEMLKSKSGKINELVYTTAVINETLRLFPVGSVLRGAPDGVTHFTTASGTYPLTSHAVLHSAQITHYSPDLFPNPTKFDPGRFLPGAPKFHRFAYRPFERGPRACIGQELAMDNMTIMLLLTARWFNFEPIIDRNTVPKEPKMTYTDWDTRIGDLAFQEPGISAGPRAGMPMKVSLTGRAR